MVGKISDVSLGWNSAKPKITFEIESMDVARQIYDEFFGIDKLQIDLKKYREKRSLDANAYCWVLIDRLAQKLHRNKTDVYKDFIRDIGGNSQIVCVIDEAVDDLRKGWEHNGIGWQTETIPSKIERCTNVILYYGSSTYNKEQMSRLLDDVIASCEEQGIVTKTPNEIARMKDIWGKSSLTA